jgi:hypothetical protein
MSDGIGFRGLSLYGVPLVFDKDKPAEDGGYIVFMTPDQFMACKAAGIDVHWMRPAHGSQREFYLHTQAPPEGDFYG